MPTTKIATCCYCGTRAALVLRGDTRHELACSACGAPLHEMKMLRIDHPHDHYRPAKPPKKPKPLKSPKPPKRRRKSLKSKIFDELWDAVEDIFD